MAVSRAAAVVLVALMAAGGASNDSPSECRAAAGELAAALHRHGLARPRPSEPADQRVAYLKTHKTASSTVGSIMLRFGARHGLRMLRRGRHYEHIWKLDRYELPAELEHTTEVAMHHVSARGTLLVNFTDMAAFYSKAMVHPFRLITILRHPVAHYLSWFYYYVEPSPKFTHDFAFYAARGSNPEPFVHEFGLHHQPELVDAFVRNVSTGNFFSLVLLSDRINDSLVAMSLLFNWRLLDVTYLRLLDSHTRAGGIRYDGAHLKPTPHLDDLDPALVARIHNLTVQDQRIYRAAEERLDAVIAAQGEQFVAARAHFESLQGLLSRHCHCQLAAAAAAARKEVNNNTNSTTNGAHNSANTGTGGDREHNLCAWYSLKDFEYEREVGLDGYAPNHTSPLLGI